MNFNLIKTLGFLIGLYIGTANPIIAGTIPNPGFELWEGTGYDNENILYWETTNKFVDMLGIYPVEKVMDKYTGNYAIRLETKPTPATMNVPGVLSLGEIHYGYTTGGIPISEQPSKFIGYFKHPTQGDSTKIIVVIGKTDADNRDIAGYGELIVTDRKDNYTKFEIQINYFRNVEEDTLNIIFMTDENSIGSTLIVDAIELEYSTTEVKQVDLNENNGSEILLLQERNNGIIEIKSRNGENIEGVRIYDINGRMLEELADINRAFVMLEINSRFPQLYLYEVRISGGKVFTGKIFY